MRNVDHINNYNLRHTFDPSIVTIKKGNTKTHYICYILVPLKQQQTEEVLLTKDLSESLIELLIEQKYITKKEDIAEVNYCGELKEFKQYEHVVVKFPLRRSDMLKGIEPHFRYYIMSVEKQKSLFPMNLCRSEHLSWLSAVKRCGSHYGLLLKIKMEL